MSTHSVNSGALWEHPLIAVFAWSIEQNSPERRGRKGELMSGGNGVRQ